MSENQSKENVTDIQKLESEASELNNAEVKKQSAHRQAMEKR